MGAVVLDDSVREVMMMKGGVPFVRMLGFGRVDDGLGVGELAAEAGIDLCEDGGGRDGVGEADLDIALLGIDAEAFDLGIAREETLDWLGAGIGFHANRKCLPGGRKVLTFGCRMLSGV
jgi:hypothetical protein